MANELATAYLTLIPTLKGAQKTIERELSAAGLEKVGEKEGEKLGDGASKSAGAKLKSGLGTAAKAAGAVAAAAFTGAFAIGKQSIDAYADYEQLVGGVETLFKDSSGQLQQYAADAYKTAGLSANDYMEQATSFSASLIKSLGGDTSKAADYANMAITDMSDNANKMGTDIGMIQNAYQGFAKQNYTMLDNLKLGYGGTKEEMQKLLDDATALSGIEYDISNYADIVDAIHVIQTEMGITGTTAAEASATISGSIASAQAAWTNWLVGLADDNADIAALTSQLVDSVVTVIGNIAPRVGEILVTLGTLLQTEAVNLFSNLIAQLQSNGPGIMAAAFDVFLNIVTAINEVITLAVDAIVLLLASLIVAIAGKAGEFFSNAVNLMTQMAAGIASGAAFVVSEIERGISDGIAKVGSFVGQMAEAGRNLIEGMVSGITSAGGAVWDAITNICSNSLGAIKSYFGIASPSKLMKETFKWIPLGAAEGIDSTASKVTKSLTDMSGNAVSSAQKSIKAGLSVTATPAAGSDTNVIIQAVIRDASDIDVLADRIAKKINAKQIRRMRAGAMA